MFTHVLHIHQNQKDQRIPHLRLSIFKVCLISAINVHVLVTSHFVIVIGKLRPSDLRMSTRSSASQYNFKFQTSNALRALTLPCC